MFSRAIIIFVGIILIIVAVVVVYQKPFLSLNPKSSPNFSVRPGIENSDLLVIDKNYRNKNGGMDNYFLVDQKGSIIKQLVPPPTQLGRANTGRISPDFQYFVYNSWDSPPPPPGCGANATSSATIKVPCPVGKYGLVIKNLDGTDEHYIYSPDANGTSYPYISSDSAKIAYSNQNATYLYDVKSQENKQIAPFPSQESIAWFPDSTKILVSDGKDNYLYQMATNGLTRISRGALPQNLATRFASISSDGKLIVALLPDGFYSMNFDGTNQKKIVVVDNNYEFSGFLEGSHKVVFSRYIPTIKGQQNTLPTDQDAVFVYDVDSGVEEKILTGANLLYTLSPDGTGIAYIDTFATPKNYKFYNITTGKTTPFLQAQDNPDPASENIVSIIDWQ